MELEHSLVEKTCWRRVYQVLQNMEKRKVDSWGMESLHGTVDEIRPVLRKLDRSLLKVKEEVAVKAF